MHVRFSTCTGMELAEEGSELFLGTLSGILIHPDNGRVEGFFVRAPGVAHDLFCSALDIVRFGTRVYVRSDDVLCDPYDIIRLASLLQDDRTVLGQKIRTESGQNLGRCSDVQFETDAMHVEWIFPRKMLRWGTAIAIADVLEIQSAAIVVRDLPQPLVQEADEESTVFDQLADVSGPAASRSGREHL